MVKRTVLLYGQSLLLSGVAAGLRECPGLQVTHAATWPAASRLLAPPAQVPDVLIFDLTNAYESHILPLLVRNPALLLVGLDMEHNQAVLLSGQQAQSLTLDQIREIVRQGAIEGGGPARSPSSA
jgi:hypothetical protein